MAQFIKLSWTDRMAFNTTDQTIRIEASCDIPWANGKWVTTNCVTHKAGSQVQVWDDKSHQLVWVRTVPITYYGGLSEEEQDKLTPIVAEGITAVILRDIKRNNRGKWYLENEEDLFSSYQKRAEDGCKFDDNELESHLSEEHRLFLLHRDKLKNVLPTELYDFLNIATSNYCNTAPEVSGMDVLKTLLNGDDEYKSKIIFSIIEGADEVADLTEIGKRIATHDNYIPNKKVFCNALYDNNMFPLAKIARNGNTRTKEQFYESVRKGF